MKIHKNWNNTTDYDDFKFTNSMVQLKRIKYYYYLNHFPADFDSHLSLIFLSQIQKHKIQKNTKTFSKNSIFEKTKIKP